MIVIVIVFVIAAMSASCDSRPDCDPIIAYAVDEEAGCVDLSPAGEVAIGCLRDPPYGLAMNTCYRNTHSGQIVFSWAIYEYADPEWEDMMGCIYNGPNPCE